MKKCLHERAPIRAARLAAKRRRFALAIFLHNQRMDRNARIVAEQVCAAGIDLRDIAALPLSPNARSA